MPFINYTDNIPAATDDPSVSQGALQINCSSVAQIVNVDLIGFNQMGNSGWHQKSTYVAGTDPGSAGGQVVEYAKVASSGSSELFLQRDGIGTVIQLTAGIPTNTGGTVNTFLAGAFIMKSFTVNIGAGGSSASPTFVGAGVGAFVNSVSTAFVTMQNPGYTVAYTALSKTQITVNITPVAAPGGVNISILVLGS